MPSTWALTPYASKSVFDPTANAEAAAWYYKKTGETGGPWSCK
jgi:soluble lytic murein transglycosylase-like protein